MQSSRTLDLMPLTLLKILDLLPKVLALEKKRLDFWIFVQMERWLHTFHTDLALNIMDLLKDPWTFCVNGAKKYNAIHTDLSFYVMDLLQRSWTFCRFLKFFACEIKKCSQTCLWTLQWITWIFPNILDLRNQAIIICNSHGPSSPVSWMEIRWSNKYIQSARILHSLPWTTAKIPVTFVQME